MSALVFKLSDFDIRRPSGTWLDGHVAHLSASSIGMFRRCPEQWRQRYVFHRKEPPGEGLVIGNFFHQTLQFNYQQKIQSHVDRPLSELVQYLQDQAVPEVIEAAGGVNEIRWDEGSGLDKGRSDASRITAEYHRLVLPRMQPVATEQRLEWHVEGMPVPVIGYLDTITQRVVDTKTGKQAPSKLKPGWQIQGDMYAAYTGLEVEYHTINRSATPKIVTPLESAGLLVTPNARMVKHVEKTMVQIAREIQWCWDTFGPEQAWPTTGRWADWTMNVLPCDFCGFRKGCPAWN